MTADPTPAPLLHLDISRQCAVEDLAGNEAEIRRLVVTDLELQIRKVQRRHAMPEWWTDETNTTLKALRSELSVRYTTLRDEWQRINARVTAGNGRTAKSRE